LKARKKKKKKNWIGTQKAGNLYGLKKGENKKKRSANFGDSLPKSGAGPKGKGKKQDETKGFEFARVGKKRENKQRKNGKPYSGTARKSVGRNYHAVVMGSQSGSSWGEFEGKERSMLENSAGKGPKIGGKRGGGQQGVN